MPTTYAIPNGRTVMDATTYTGNATAGTNISNADNGTTGFKPDFVWIKDRTNSTDHILTDSVRGVTKTLFSDLTTAETTVAGGLTAFNNNGFQLGFDGSNIVNNTGNNYVAWQWQAGQGSTSSNTNGSITSTVSVNATAGFSVVTYTGNGVASTVGHGLGTAPQLVITKSRNDSTYGWATYHVSVGAGACLFLNTTGASNAGVNIWNNTSPTSSVFSIGTDQYANFSGKTYVAYCWAQVAGFSQFGSYTGNGSADGPFVYLGFRPRWVLWKRTDSASGNGWYLLDSARNTYNVEGERLFPNLSNGGSYDVQVDFLSNGIKFRTTDTDTNASGGTYIYAAFAENPFKYANAR